VSIFVNSKEQSVPDACSVQALLELNGLTEKRVAVEVNQELVVRGQWHSFKLKQGDRVEPLATNRLDDPIDASPVAVGRQLFLRGERYLYCIEE